MESIRVTHAAALQQKLDDAVTAGEIKEDLYRLLSTGMKRLREAELKEESVDERRSSSSRPPGRSSRSR